MKTTLSILFTGLMAFASVAQGDTYQTLTGYRDSIKIPAGQTAFFVSASQRLILGVQKPGKRELLFRFEDATANFQLTVTNSNRRNLNFLPTPSIQHPVPIAGPATVILRTSGLATLSLPSKTRTYSTSSGPTVRRFAQK